MPHSVQTILAAALLMGLVSAQGIVQGTVTNFASGEPLVGANVVVKGTSIGDAADDSGQYTLMGLNVGNVTLVFTAIGFETAQRTVLVAASPVTLDLALQPIVLQAPALTVVRQRVNMIGGQANLASIPGSAHIISNLELRRKSETNIHRLLQQVPGINIQEEDGFGLRPNIGMRGTGVERSRKIALMEDGVLIAPAPYAAPSAYYFPEVGRMESIEVRKGSSQIKYGPNTNGGALNLISTSLPGPFASHLNLSTGAYNSHRVHLNAGASNDRVGWLLETYQHANDGFKVIDFGGNTGFRITDYLAKLRLSSLTRTGRRQSLELKLGNTDELSHETYLGLSDSDFSSEPYRRYAASRKDRMEARHRQVGLTHFLYLGPKADVTTTLYRNNFARNWYKLDRTGGVKIADILADPAGFPGPYELLSASDSEPGQYDVKANNRTYVAQGVQSLLVLEALVGRVPHSLEIGLRVHKDAEDRFQHVDHYQMVAAEMVLSNAGIPGTGIENNLVSGAAATALFVQDKFALGSLTVTTGLRYESILFSRKDYGPDDPQRTGGELTFTTTSVSAWIPGLGIDFKPGPALTMFGGIHKGFAPPGPDSQAETRAEESVNLEAGLRYQGPALNLFGVAFFNRYGNLLGSDLSAVGGEGSGRQFNGGGANVAGLEAAVSYHIRRPGLTIPASATYTLTLAEFKNDYESEYKPWGTVQAGDELPYLPRHQLVLSVGWDRARWGLALSGRYVSPMRTEAGKGPMPLTERTDASLVFDLSSEFRVAHQVSLYVKAANLTDQIFVVARRPAGVRPGLPRTVSAGVRLDL